MMKKKKRGGGRMEELLQAQLDAQRAENHMRS